MQLDSRPSVFPQAFSKAAHLTDMDEHPESRPLGSGRRHSDRRLPLTLIAGAIVLLSAPLSRADIRVPLFRTSAYAGTQIPTSSPAPDPTSGADSPDSLTAADLFSPPSSTPSATTATDDPDSDSEAATPSVPSPTSPAATPAPQSGTAACSGCVAVPSTIDATGKADASALLQAFLATVPDGSTITFEAGAVYQMSVGLLVQNRHDLTFLGNGATLLAGPQGTGEEAESLFLLGGVPVRPSTGITIRGFNLVGNSPQPGVYLRGRPEFAAGITIYGGSDIEVDAVTISRVFGDGLTANGGVNGVWFHDSHVISNGRNGVAVIAASNVTVERSQFDTAGYCTFDVEPWAAGTVVRNIAFVNNTAGSWTNTFLSANGNPGTDVQSLTVSGNTVTGKSLGTIIDLEDRRSNVVFTNNKSLVATAGPVLRLAYIDGLTVTGNVQPLTSGTLAQISDSTGVVYEP